MNWRAWPAVASLHQYWVRTIAREQLTRRLDPIIASLHGVVADVGGGRESPHDRKWSAEAIRVTIDRDLARRPQVVADAASLPFPAGALDVVLMFQLLEHLESPAAAVDEAARAVKKDGVVYGSVPFVFPVHGDPDDYLRFTESAVRSLLKGFQRSNVEAYGNGLAGAWLLIAARSRLARLLNPAARAMLRGTDGSAPLGYVFGATNRSEWQPLGSGDDE